MAGYMGLIEPSFNKGLPTIRMSAEVAGTHGMDTVGDQSSKSQVSVTLSYYTEAPSYNTTYTSTVQRQLVKGSN